MHSLSTKKPFRVVYAKQLRCRRVHRAIIIRDALCDKLHSLITTGRYAMFYREACAPYILYILKNTCN